MKVCLSDQIEEATRYRDALERLHDEGVKFTEAPDLETRLHRAEGIVLTLHPGTRARFQRVHAAAQVRRRVVSGDGTIIFKGLCADLDRERNGDAVDRFVSALREVDEEYGRADIGPTAAMAEVRAALRQLDRDSSISRGKRK